MKNEKEFDALLEAYKLQNPAKYELKMKNGEFDRQRKLYKPTPIETVKEPQAPEVPEAPKKLKAEKE